MPIRKRWTRFTWDNIDNVPSDAGCYELGYLNRNVAYVGKSNDLQRRLTAHKKSVSKGKLPFFRYELAGFFDDPADMERNHGENYEKTRGCLPPKQRRLPRSRSLFPW